MDKNLEKPVDPRTAARAGAQSAASSQALGARVRELETVLAVERAENAKRLREVDGHMRVMRTSLGELQADFRRLSEEREQLRGVVADRDRTISELSAQLEQTKSRVHDEAAEREGAAARAVSAAIERAQAAEIELNELRTRIGALEEQLVEARSEGEVAADQRIRDLEKRVGERELQLIRAADMLDRYESRFARSEERAESAVRVAAALSRDAGAPIRTHVEVTSAPVPPVPPAPPVAATAPVAPPSPAMVDDDDDDDADPDAAESDTFDPGHAAGGRVRGPLTKATQSSARRTDRRRPRGSTGGSESVDDLLLDDTRDELPVVHRDGRRYDRNDDSGEEPAPRLDSPSRVNERPGHAERVSDADRVADAERLPDIEGVDVESEVSATPAGRVYFGRVVRTRRPVLVQMLPGRLADLDATVLDRLMTTRHAHIVAALSYGESTAAGPFVVLERPEGDDADHTVRRGGALAEEQALAFVRQAARGLAYAAGQGFVHGDLRPWSLRVGHGSHVQVLGVGTNVVAGPHRRPAASPEFAAPERLNADGAVDARSDIFSLGAILYYLLTGRAPFEGAAEDVVRRDPTAACPDPRTANPEISAHAAELVARWAHPNAAARPATWEDVLLELERPPVDEPPEDPTRAIVARVKAWFVANPIAAVAAALVPLVVIVAMFVVMGPDEPNARERFEIATVRAQSLATAGDVDGARQVYAAFLTGTGDPDVEREAASRIDSLYR